MISRKTYTIVLYDTIICFKKREKKKISNVDLIGVKPKFTSLDVDFLKEIVNRAKVGSINFANQTTSKWVL